MTAKKSILTMERKKNIALNVRPGMLGKEAVDIRPLGAQELCSYDPGFNNTSGCESAITYIDAANSVLLHRGFPVYNWLKNVILPRCVTSCCTVMRQIVNSTISLSTSSHNIP